MSAARPTVVVGDYGVEVFIPGLRLVSEANAREHWRTRATRTKRQKQLVLRVLTACCGPFPPPTLSARPYWVRIRRYSPGRLDDDNAVGSAKHVRDAVATWLGVNDGDVDAARWVVMQQRSKTYGVEICILRAT